MGMALLPKMVEKAKIMAESVIRLRPEKILFRNKSIIIAESGNRKGKIPYEQIVTAFLSVQGGESGDCLEPEITEITGDMDGELILRDRANRRWEIRTDLTGETAGALLEKLCIHAPYVLAGGQSWSGETGEEDFRRLAEMVGLMRSCEKMGRRRTKRTAR